ncbi:MAG: Gfo/Idh/MocA family oxidoreductase [Fimbriimonadaceae bacterium]|nr:Gfo/Idh/MocA family oxidoreductase [Fimbriimonadaceae bacterium]
MSEIRIGFVGVGQIAKSHLKQYQGVPGAKVVAATDINPDELARVAAEYGIEHTYSDFREMLQRDDLDAVDVCLHNNFHAPVTIAALQAGKHVYCEKPMAGAYVDAVAMQQTAAETGRKLHIQLSTLYSKEAKIAKKLIDEGHLGTVYHARSTGFRRRGRPFVDGYGTPSFVKKEVAAGGALYDMGVYHISQILWLLGLPEVQRISGKVYQETEMDPGRQASSGYNVEELGLGFVKCAGGVTIDLIEAWAMHLGGLEGSCLLGSRGGLRIEPFSYFNNTADVPMNATFDISGADWRWHQLDPTQAWYDSSQHHWIAALQGHCDLLPTAATALATMLISEGIYLSDRLGREVTRDEVLEMSVSTAIKL